MKGFIGNKFLRKLRKKFLLRKTGFPTTSGGDCTKTDCAFAKR